MVLAVYSASNINPSISTRYIALKPQAPPPKNQTLNQNLTIHNNATIMRFTTLATTLTTLTAASARIIGISAPTTLAPNSTFNLTLLTENYIQSVSDISVAWGYSLSPGYPTTLGSFVQSSYLGPNKSNTLENVTVQATVPAQLENEAYNGTLVLSAAVYSLYGASGTVSVAGFNVSVEVGEETSETVVSSDGFGWIVNSQSQS